MPLTDISLHAIPQILYTKLQIKWHCFCGICLSSVFSFQDLVKVKKKKIICHLALNIKITKFFLKLTVVRSIEKMHQTVRWD